MRAYMLIQNRVGASARVAGEVAEIKGVISAEAVTGPYDVIALAEARNLDDQQKRRAAREHGYRVVEIAWSRRRKPGTEDLDELRAFLQAEIVAATQNGPSVPQPVAPAKMPPVSVGGDELKPPAETPTARRERA